MCGISGVVSVNKCINVQNLKNMTDIIRHRGPDDEGFYLYGKYHNTFAYGQNSIIEVKNSNINAIEELYDNEYHLAFGHRRLSIIDLSNKGHQPTNFSGVVITYNGEIYNYIELREELKKLGYCFQTEGDTEVIVNAYKEWGENCVYRFNGMWAFAIWDIENCNLFCSRDRLGEKPFYYYLTDNEFVFGSEIKQLIKYGIPSKVNEKMLLTYLFYGFHDFSEETFFDNIYSLQGGYNLSIKTDFENERMLTNKYCYWNITMKREKSSYNFNEESELIGNELEKSIALRLRSDVEIGSCLSGGLDSSSVVTLACNQLHKRKFDTKIFKTFTACYDEFKEVDERYYSDLVVENSECDNIKVKPNIHKLKNDLNKLIWHQDEPFGSLSIFASWCVMEQARKNGIKVLLDGQGGDETLLGYERFYAYSLKEKLMDLKYIDFYNEFKLSSKNSNLTLSILLKYMLYFNNTIIRKKRVHYKASKFLNPEYMSTFKYLDVDNILKFETVDDAQKNEITKFLGHLLRYEDRNSMAHSIEARVPFLDPIFVEKAISLPNHFKLKDGWTKAILRKYMEDKMPIEVVYRKNKLGFNVPQTKWLNELNDYFRDNLLNDARSSRYFNIEYIKKIFDNKTNEDIRFKFIMVELWMRVFEIN